MSREAYEPPAVREQSVEEVLTEAQAATDEVCRMCRDAQAKLEDLFASLSTLNVDIEKLEAALTVAEGKVMKLAHVGQGERDGNADRRE